MFRKILIANRGEIAVRIMRACRDLNISPIAVFSEADAAALHVRMSNEAYCIGPAAATESYLNIKKIRSEEHTSELQSLRHLVCRLLLEKKKKKKKITYNQ